MTCALNMPIPDYRDIVTINSTRFSYFKNIFSFAIYGREFSRLLEQKLKKMTGQRANILLALSVQTFKAVLSD